MDIRRRMTEDEIQAVGLGIPSIDATALLQDTPRASPVKGLPADLHIHVEIRRVFSGVRWGFIVSPKPEDPSFPSHEDALKGLKKWLRYMYGEE